LFAAVFATFICRAIDIVWRESKDDSRGSNRMDGYHILHSEYSSGVSGHQTTYKVGCDPKEYACIFTPQNTDSNK
jgi:hypothetical protein